MFERFTDRARQVAVLAQEQARERRADAIRSEHILLGLYRVPDNLAVVALARLGVRPADVVADVDLRAGAPPSEAEALATLGIDLDEVRRQIEDAFGPGALDRTRAGRSGARTGHIRFDRTAKKVLELALREALVLGHDHIGTEHILLGMLHERTGTAHDVLAGRGVTRTAARIVVEELVRTRRAS
jgi:ATP-dependent Clp protease ATP-binding subunit ClpA